MSPEPDYEARVVNPAGGVAYGGIIFGRGHDVTELVIQATIGSLLLTETWASVTLNTGTSGPIQLSVPAEEAEAHADTLRAGQAVELVLRKVAR